MNELKTWKLQWPQSTNGDPMILIYSVDAKSGERQELGEQYQMPATVAMRKLFRKKGARPGYWAKIYVRGIMGETDLVFHSFALRGLWQ